MAIRRRWATIILFIIDFNNNTSSMAAQEYLLLLLGSLPVILRLSSSIIHYCFFSTNFLKGQNIMGKLSQAKS